MGFLDVGRSALLPRGSHGKRARVLFFCHLYLRRRRFFLANFRTTVPKDLLEHLGEVSDHMETIHYLPRLRCTQSRGFGKLLATISAHNADFRVRFEPGFDGRAFSISKHINNFSALQID